MSSASAKRSEDPFRQKLYMEYVLHDHSNSPGLPPRAYFYIPPKDIGAFTYVPPPIIDPEIMTVDEIIGTRLIHEFTMRNPWRPSGLRIPIEDIVAVSDKFWARRGITMQRVQETRERKRRQKDIAQLHIETQIRESQALDEACARMMASGKDDDDKPAPTGPLSRAWTWVKRSAGWA